MNRTASDVVLLVVGDRTAGDEVFYPDVDMHGRMGPDGRFTYSRKNGEPY